MRVTVARRRMLREAGTLADAAPVRAGATGVVVALGLLLHMVNGDRVQQLAATAPLLGAAPVPVGTVAR